MPSHIHDYAIIGDCRSAALVSRSGSIDWLCWPRFDSPSIFGAFLDERAGVWSLVPADVCGVERRYIQGTNVFETRFHPATVTLLLVDFMPVASEEEKGARFLPDHEILHTARYERVEVDIAMTLEPRPATGDGARAFAPRARAAHASSRTLDCSCCGRR